ncbi:MAG: FkbM family methyltransferase [Bryobacteraceae bacterium]
MTAPMLTLARAPAMRPLRNALRPALSLWGRPVGVRLASGHRCFVDLRSAIGRGLLVRGRFDESICDVLRRYLKPGDTFVDAGANIGYYSLTAVSLLGDSGEVHAFEIDPRALRCLRKTIRKNRLRGISLHEIALGETGGAANLIMSGDCGHTYVQTRAGGEGAVPVKPLDDWLDHFRPRGVRLIKIDVEGSELPVLRGARGVLQVCRPVVVCEAAEDNLNRSGATVSHLVEYMESLGYGWEPLPGNDPCLLFQPGRAE